MIFKLILWAVIGYFVYNWFQNRLSLNKGEGKTTIHHDHHKEGQTKKKGNDDDYIEYEDVK